MWQMRNLGIDLILKIIYNTRNSISDNRDIPNFSTTPKVMSQIGFIYILELGCILFLNYIVQISDIYLMAFIWMTLLHIYK
jgi:hypothetical protein